MLDNNSTLIIGKFSNGSISNSYFRAFKNLNSNVMIINVLSFKLIKNKIFNNSYFRKLFDFSYSFRKMISIEFNKEIKKKLLQYNCKNIFILSPEWLTHDTLVFLKNKGFKICCFFGDNPIKGYYNHRPEYDITFKEFDILYLWSYSLVRKFRKMKYKNVKFLPFGWDSYIHPFSGIKEGNNKISFIGNWEKHREKILLSLFSNFSIDIYGANYWITKSRNQQIKKNYKALYLDNKNFAKTISDYSINLNILREQHYVNNIPDAVIMRSFEVPGSGGFLISNRCETALDLFTEDYDAVFYDTTEELKDKLIYYLKNNKQRMEIIKNSHRKIKKNFQYHNIAQIVLNDLNKLS